MCATQALVSLEGKKPSSIDLPPRYLMKTGIKGQHRLSSSAGKRYQAGKTGLRFRFSSSEAKTDTQQKCSIWDFFFSQTPLVDYLAITGVFSFMLEKFYMNGPFL